MAKQELRDRNHHLLGHIETRSSGILEGRDKNHRLRGTYDPKRDETRDHNNRLVGKGNMLAALIINPLV